MAEQRDTEAGQTGTPAPESRAVLLGNGAAPSPDLLAACLEDGGLLLCADGGANAAAACGRTPDWVVGDLDSVEGPALDRVPPERRVRVDADDTGTDLEKVLRHALGLGVTEAVLLGFTGGRVDHTLWNLSVLAAYGRRLRLHLVDAFCEVWPVGQGLRFRAQVGQRLSLSTPSGPVTGVTTRGLRWPLDKETLAPGQRDGISNEVVASPVEIDVGCGDLLVCAHRDCGRGSIEIVR